MSSFIGAKSFLNSAQVPGLVCARDKMSQEMIQLWVYNQGGAPHVAKCRPSLSPRVYPRVCCRRRAAGGLLLRRLQPPRHQPRQLQVRQVSHPHQQHRHPRDHITTFCYRDWLWSNCASMCHSKYDFQSYRWAQTDFMHFIKLHPQPRDTAGSF